MTDIHLYVILLEKYREGGWIVTRVLKDPEIRKQEILDTAMKLFHEKGYDATSIADIAKAMNVVPGLCYRYFASKKEIFDVAVKEYAKESCQDTVVILQDSTKSIKERIEALGLIMLHKEDNSRHHDFFHTDGNETFHLQLSIEMINYLTPYISKELSELKRAGKITVDDPELMTRFILFGEISLLVSPSIDTQSNPLEEQIKQTQEYIYRLLDVKE